MSEEKNTYYVAVESGEILRTASDSPWNFQIEASDEEITRLRDLFDANYDTEIAGFIRAHVPFVEYSNDPTNDEFDERFYEIYEMLYELGNEEARNFIDSIGILNNFTSK